MLEASEFFVGSLTHAEGLCFMASWGKRGGPILVSPGQPRTAVFLSDEFQGFSFVENDTWKGVIVPNIRIEVDASSAFDADNEFPAGSMVRHDDKLSIIAALNSGGWHENKRVSLVTDLPSCGAGKAAGFRRWQLVVGTGAAKQIVQTIDLTI